MPETLWKKLLWLLVLGMTCVTALAAETEPNRRPAINFTNFEPNLPIIILEAKEQIISERKVPCTVKMVCHQGQVL